jgi:RIO kinase 1
MRIPDRLQPLVDANLIDEVLSQLPSGKEADVYVVYSEGEYRCAKIYKESNNRSFKQRALYTEGRKVRNSRQSRAMSSKNKSRYGQEQAESEWMGVEVEALHKLAEANVVVPTPYAFYEGVLLLEMIAGADGEAAPRLDEVNLTPDLARKYYKFLIREVVKMLCAGYVHGDLSEFNILVSKKGPVIIDLPQAVLATSNNAAAIFERDIVHLCRYFGRYAPEISETKYAKEMWALFLKGKLRPNTKLTGLFKESTKKVDITEVMSEIEDAREEEMERRRNDES